MIHGILSSSFSHLIFLVVIILIIKFWVIHLRGFMQLAVFTLSEIGFVCNRGVPCSNCLLSFGICPIGFTQRLLFMHNFSLYITLFSTVIVGLVFGSLTCGWLCPVGFIQDVFHSPGIKEIKFTNKLSTLRYFIFFLIAIFVFLELYFNFFNQEYIGLYQKTPAIIGGILLATAIFIKRPVCRLFCPVGLIYGKLNKISPIKVMLAKKQCPACGECDKVCITDIKPLEEVNGNLCVKCFNCAKICKQSKDS